MTQGSYICGRCTPPRPLSHRPLSDRRHSARGPGRGRARPDSVVVPLCGSATEPIRQKAGTKAPPVWHSLHTAAAAALSPSYARGGTAGYGRRCPAAMAFDKRCPAGPRLRLARSRIHRLAGEPWHDYPNRRGDRRHWNRRDRRQRRSVRAHGYPGEHGIAVFTEVSALLGQGIYGLGEGFRRRSCGFFAEPGCSTIGPSAADGLRRS